MACLSSEDRDQISAFEISPSTKCLSTETYPDQVYQYFRWSVSCGQRKIESAPADKNGKEELIEDGYLLFRKPRDEVKLLIRQLEALRDRESEVVIFEPAEPSFDLKILRPDNDEEGLKVFLFVDESSVETGISRWDAIGIRYFTDDEKLTLFINELKSEFNC